MSAYDETAARDFDQRYPWRGAKASDLEMACAQIARRLLASGRTVVGFLPTPGSRDLVPLLVRLGRALFPFQQRQAAVVPPWRQWDDASEDALRLGDGQHAPSLRPVPGQAGPTLVVPPACPDASTAVLSLQLALRRMDRRFPQVLVDLTGLTGIEPGNPMAVLRLVDGVAVVGRQGKTLVGELQRAAREIGDDKSLGVVVVG
ncbi:MAG TPA: hypothetical protein VNO55_17920 [Polyangia bacterium]|nr:hypothetical protein [Polyangia bacterium]